MNWICPICSSSNDAAARICFVCGYEKAAPSICTLTKKRVRELRLTGDVVIPEAYNVIGEGAFLNRKDITSVRLHQGMKRISKEAFCGCGSLTRVDCPVQLDAIGMRAFADCPSLAESHRASARRVAKDAYELTPTPPKPITPPASRAVTPPPKRVEPPPVKTARSAESFRKEDLFSIFTSIFLPLLALLVFFPALLLVTNLLDVGFFGLFLTVEGAILRAVFCGALCEIIRNRHYREKRYRNERVHLLMNLLILFALTAAYDMLLLVGVASMRWICTAVCGVCLLSECILIVTRCVRRDRNNRIFLASTALVTVLQLLITLAM